MEKSPFNLSFQNEIFRILFGPKFGGNVNLELAIRRRFEQVAILLLENGAEPRGHGYFRPIHLAINTGQYKIANQLIKYGAHFESSNPGLAYDYSHWHKFRHFYWGKGS